MIIMLSGPNKRLGFSAEVKKVLNRELKNCKSLVAIGAKELSEKNYKYFNGGEDSVYHCKYDSSVEKPDGAGAGSGTLISGCGGSASGDGYDKRTAQKERGEAENGDCGYGPGV